MAAESVVFGIFSSREQMETALEEMRREGFRNADISVLFHNDDRTEDFAGGALESLAGIGVLVNAGLTPFVAAGPVMALLSDASTGSVIGGLTGALMRVSMPENAAGRYAERIRSGAILLSVHADDFKWIRKARKVFKVTGGEDITSQEE
jgi:hypothetical protein